MVENPARVFVYCLQTKNVALVTSNTVSQWILAQYCCHQSVRRESLLSESRICKCCVLDNILCSYRHHSEILGPQAGLGGVTGSVLP